MQSLLCDLLVQARDLGSSMLAALFSHGIEPSWPRVQAAANPVPCRRDSSMYTLIGSQAWLEQMCDRQVSNVACCHAGCCSIAILLRCWWVYC